MKFKKLEIAGFKSFADKLQIKFGSGITAIVGPNGCGKSNVADSIRWVLGEQSAKLLRGTSMQDVIFNGTKSRKSLSFCEVDLFFDNTNKELFPSLDFNEVVISRKLYRSGESEYLLNKTVVRLKDIIDLLRDANMGKEGYSIIGQGRIDELLSSKPEDRRAIFEEAAGIAKHKSKKKEAERRLERVQNELNLAQVVVDEKSKQLEPLTKQAENARKWLEFRDKLKNHEINMYIYQQDTASEAKAVISTRLDGVNEEIALRQNERDEISNEYNKAMLQMNEADDTIKNLRDEFLTISVGREKLTGEIKLLNERLGYLTLQSEKISEDNSKLNVEYELFLKLIEQGNSAVTAFKSEYEQKKQAEEALHDEYLKVTDQLAQGEGEVELRHREVVEAMDKLTDIKSNMSRLLTERESLGVAMSGLSERIKFNTDKLTIDEQEEKELKIEIERLSNERDEYIKERETTITLNNENVFIVNETAQKLDKLNENFYSLKTRLKLITEIKDSQESFSSSVKRLLADAKGDEALSSRMEGFVAQLIKVKEGYETAIEMALGNSVQNIVTKNEDDAKFLINYLKRKNYGRVTFLPMTSLKPRSIEPRFYDLLGSKGCFGRASSLISYDEKYEPIIKGLLGGTVVVDNIETAVELAKKSGYSFRIVTLDGDIIDPRGSIAGGSKKSELSNIFSHDRELNSLNFQISQAQAQIDELNNKRMTNAQTVERTQTLMRVLREKIHAIEIDIASKTETHRKLIISNEELTKSIGNLEFERLEASERFDAIDKDLNSVTELENIVKSEKDFAAAGGEERMKQFDVLRATRNSLHERMMSTKMELSALENSLQNNESEIRRLQENVALTIEKIEANNIMLAECKQSIERLTNELNMLVISDNSIESDRAVEIRKMLDDIEEFKREKQQSVKDLDEKRMAIIAELTNLHEKKNREEMLLLKVDSDIEVLQQRIFEEYSLVYEDCLKFKDESYDLASGTAEAAKIKRQMSYLGNVNVDAIEQCREVFAEYEALNIKRGDLIKSKTDLEQIIQKFNTEMLERFTESFAAIRTNFQRIFKELFDGGTADLSIQEGENVLEAGIEIIAQPPEKKLQSISLLSGGERALTAIAILFAILRLKPMPFCVLDEIEAALDDTNATRFAKYLRRFSEGTQFIVITHRKPTMELADNLYGVTMEEKGVSKIVSVKLSEAVAVAEQSSVS